MPRIHPKTEGFAALAGRLSADDRRLLRHALGCAACREALFGALAAELDRPVGRVLAWRSADQDYGRAIDDVLEACRPRLCQAAREQQEAPVLLAELLRHPPERREVLLRNSARFKSFALCERLLQASREEVQKDARAGEELARLALRLADLLDAERIGPRIIEDLRCRGWSLVGNALRVLSDLRAAEEALATADLHLRHGTGDRLELARLLTCKASLRRYQRRYAEAGSLLRRAAAMALEVGDGQLAGEVMVLQAIVCKQVGEPVQAIELLRQAGELIDAEADPRLALAARHNLIDLLVEQGRMMEAQALLARSRDIYRRHAEPRMLLRLLWVEGKISYGMGQLPEAAELLGRVRVGFIEQGLGYDAAIASLDLAAVCARLGHTSEVRRLAEEMLPIFRSREVHREALAALIVFQQAAQSESATLDLVEEIAAYLRRAAGDPTLAFERRT
jgi:tetratricopeptide (TPR) repeat protein